jgi:hypothetical protein
MFREADKDTIDKLLTIRKNADNNALS